MYGLRGTPSIATLSYLIFVATPFLPIVPAARIHPLGEYEDLPPEDKWPPLAADYNPPTTNYSKCNTAMNGMGLYRVQDVANDMLEHIADTQIGVSSKGLTRHGKYNGGCQRIWSIAGAPAAYLCVRDADADVFDCGDFKGGDMANALLELNRDCFLPDCNGMGPCQAGGTIWINGRKNESCRGHPLGAYFAQID